MKIVLKPITVRDIFSGYKDNAEEGVVGYGGKLNIRPAYQREYVYKKEQRNEVIRTVTRGFPNTEFPLNVMYWAKTDEDNFELIDGQQRTISLCRYVNKEFSILIDGMPQNFDNLSQESYDQSLKQLFEQPIQNTFSLRLQYFIDYNDAKKLLRGKNKSNS